MTKRKDNFTVSLEDWKSKILSSYENDATLVVDILKDWCEEDGTLILIEDGTDYIDNFWQKDDICFDDSLLDGCCYDEY